MEAPSNLISAGAIIQPTPLLTGRILESSTVYRAVSAFGPGAISPAVPSVGQSSSDYSAHTWAASGRPTLTHKTAAWTTARPLSASAVCSPAPAVAWSSTDSCDVVVLGAPLVCRLTVGRLTQSQSICADPPTTIQSKRTLSYSAAVVLVTGALERSSFDASSFVPSLCCARQSLTGSAIGEYGPSCPLKG
uniref:Uncharacterized protein n=1 Tax=Plectus sambesii TaxID=2011161 RepID=A0A914WIM8_9BILA